MPEERNFFSLEHIALPKMESVHFSTTFNNEVRRKLGLTTNEYLVALFILNRLSDPSNQIGGWCDVSKAQIAAHFDLSERTVFAIFKTLFELQILEKHNTFKELIRTTQKFYDCQNCSETAKIAETSQNLQTIVTPSPLLPPTPPNNSITPEKALGSNEPKQRNADVDRILEEFSEVTGYSQPTDKKPRQWAYLFAKNKGVDNFRAVLLFLIQDKKYDLNKLETVYRKYPVYEADVLKIKPRVQMTGQRKEIADIYAARAAQ